MSWSQVLNDVTSRISAASQSLQTLDPYHQTQSSTSALPGTQSCGPAYPDPQSSSMSVRVQLDQRDAPYYTNLDSVTGRVNIGLATETTISAINVKLEGESRTRLSGPKYQNDPRNRQKIELEVHKVGPDINHLLYKVQTIYPDSGYAQESGIGQYVLPPGQYSFPFSLKIPFNNNCSNNNKFLQDLSLGSLLMQDVTTAKHVRQTLPPVVSGFPGEAEIKYFIKATVVRPKFYQENLRCVTDIRFQPVEPPRPAPRNEETYARRQHQFQNPTMTTPKSSRSSFFKKSTPASTQPDGPPPAIKVEVRLPSPTIVSCNQPLPLRIMIEKTNESSASFYLSVLQIELIGFTNVRAHELNRTETNSWVVLSKTNMKQILEKSTDDPNSYLIPSKLWDNVPLPSTIIPSFSTCNLSRRYDVEIRVGISHGTSEAIGPELIVLPLRIPIQVYSGITPPASYLNNISTQQPTSSNLAPPRPSSAQYQHSPITPTQDQFPAQPGSYMAPPPDDPDDLPPSYEDAIAEDIGPVDGPRRDTIPSTPTGRRQSSNPDSKSNMSGLGRHPSERLFSQNAPAPPSATGSTPLRHQQYVSPTVEDVSDVLTGMNVIDNDTPNRPIPPPLPARKGTKDSLLGRKGTA